MSVAIIGGGMAGLAAAKACVEVGLRPHIFEQSAKLGGLWSSQSTLCRPSMQLNASKHCCAFSDHPWASRRTFPTALEMSGYLESYAQKFIDPSFISFERRVINAQLNDAGKWLVTWSSATEANQVDSFDSLIVATGIFSKPFTPEIAGSSEYPGIFIHSADFRDFESIRGKRVAIVGDSFSAVELAAEIAPQTASLVHIHPRPSWAFPRILPIDPSRPDSPFAPSDIINFTRAKHKAMGTSENVFPTKEANKGKNAYFKSVLGDQGDLSDGMKIPDDLASFVSVSDTYANSVRQGTISPVLGRLAGIKGSSLVLSDDVVLDGEVDIVIMATGFATTLPFLNEDIQRDLSYEPKNLRVPILLHRSVFHPSPRLANAAFVGMYRGPYMGVIELQSKWAAQVLAGVHPWPTKDEQAAGIALEQSIRDMESPTQFPHGDYVGLMMDLSRELGIDAVASWPGRNTDFVSAAQFNHGDVPSQILKQVEDDLSASLKGRFISAGIYNAWQGEWKLHRRLESRLDKYPSGTFNGTATFTRATPAKPGDDGPEYEYKYLERGKLRTDAGLEFDAQRRYRYQYDDKEDRIDAFFDDSSGEGWFHSLQILAPDQIPLEKKGYDGQWEPWVGEKQPGWRAIGQHWCAPDQYTVAYWFLFKGIHLEEFRISYKVKGPHKDYVSSATYTRK